MPMTETDSFDWNESMSTNSTTSSPPDKTVEYGNALDEIRCALRDVAVHDLQLGNVNWDSRSAGYLLEIATNQVEYLSDALARICQIVVLLK